MQATETSTTDALRRVMCVEDDPDIRMILEFSLGRLAGYDVCLCASGAQALEQVPQFRPQLILLDVMMPDMSGPQTLEQLRAQRLVDGVAVVFLTAKAMTDELEDLLLHGAAGIIVKPFDPVTLGQDIRIYWQHGRRPSPA